MRNHIALRLARYGVFAAFVFSFGARDACPFGSSHRPPEPPPEPPPKQQVEPSQGTFATPPPGKEDPPEDPRPEPVPQPPG